MTKGLFNRIEAVLEDYMQVKGQPEDIEIWEGAEQALTELREFREKVPDEATLGEEAWHIVEDGAVTVEAAKLLNEANKEVDGERYGERNDS